MAAYAALAFLSLLWDSSFLLIKIAACAFDPFALALARNGVAALSPRRQRMRNERAVNGDQSEPFDLTLREQHPIERIASRRLGLDRGEGMALVDRDDPYAQSVEKLGQGAEARLQPELAQSMLDGDFPKAGRAQMLLIVSVAQQRRNARRQADCAAR